jgi:hypothetical protein
LQRARSRLASRWLQALTAPQTNVRNYPPARASDRATSRRNAGHIISECPGDIILECPGIGIRTEQTLQSEAG